MKRDGRPSLREIEVGIARRAGYDGDTRRFVRALVERRSASLAALTLAFRDGERAARAKVQP